jgi:hypothetical protein
MRRRPARSALRCALHFRAPLRCSLRRSAWALPQDEAIDEIGQCAACWTAPNQFAVKLTGRIAIVPLFEVRARVASSLFGLNPIHAHHAHRFVLTINHRAV